MRSSTRNRFGTLLSTFIALAALPSSAGAAILSVDLQAGGGVVQPGFTAWNITGDSIPNSQPNPTVFTTSLGPVTATLVGGPTVASLDGTGLLQRNSRNRENFIFSSGAFTQADLMRDRAVVTGTPTNPTTGAGSGNGLYLRLEGLAASTSYTFQMWGVDYLGDGTLKGGWLYLYDATHEEADGTLDLLGNYTVTAGTSAIADNGQFGITATVTTDADGTMIVKSISNIDGSGIMNGFVVIPEPSGLALAGVAIAGFLCLRRRHG